MDEIKFDKIGNYSSDNGQTRIELLQGFGKALKVLDTFSHAIFYTVLDTEIMSFVGKIVRVSVKEELVAVDQIHMTGNLVDIKPFYPCEDIVKEFEKPSLYSYRFENRFIASYAHIQEKGVLKLNMPEAYNKLKGLKSGDFLQIFWWFHRFDKKEFRRIRESNPPYPSAPKCGIFATRSPVRPNPLASTIVKVTEVDPYNGYIYVLGFDGIPGSKILQISPYTPLDTSLKIQVPEWVDHWTKFKTFNIENSQMLIEKNNVPFDDILIDELMDRDEKDKSYDHDHIVVEGASTHNLKDIDVLIPKKKVTVITGVSGSGKSSLAFDTIYKESREKYIDLLSPDASAGIDIEAVTVKSIKGLQPAIAVEQRSLGNNPRSTVATVSKIGGYLKLIYTTLGVHYCGICNTKLTEDNVCANCNEIYFPMTPSTFGYNNPEAMCPVCKGLGEAIQIDENLIISKPELSILDGASDWWGNLRKHRDKPNANWMRGEVLALAIDLKEDLEVPYSQLTETFRNELFYGTGEREVSLSYKNNNGRAGVITRPVEGVVHTMNRFLNDNTEKSIGHLEEFLKKEPCSKCQGERLRNEGRLVSINGARYPEVVNLCITDISQWCHSTYNALEENDKVKSRDLFRQLVMRLDKLERVGLGYLSLDRSVPTLSGGESQRVKLATQFGTGLSDILYVLDEPSKGLHPKDYGFLIETIRDLNKYDNTVLIVEHKQAFIDNADFHIEIGPKAGRYGGELIRAEYIVKNQDRIEAINVDYKICDIENDGQNYIELLGVKTNNLKNIDIEIPTGKLTCVVGVSGSGKSSVISETLYPNVARHLGSSISHLGIVKKINGLEYIRDVNFVSQKAIGKNARSNPATYTGVFDLIRVFYSKLEQSKELKLTKEHFSFNSKKGQCSECNGLGQIPVPMHFMNDIYASCTACGGKRYKESVLAVEYKGYNISQLLSLEIREVADLFSDHEPIALYLNMLVKVGIGYIKLGQSASTLSGGEAQRVKLAKELSAKTCKDVLYILDEPTTGLHHDDIDRLIDVINELTLRGGTVVVIEHNQQLIERSDWIIELGPVGGGEGGFVTKMGWLDRE